MGDYDTIPMLITGFADKIKEGAYTRILEDLVPDLEVQLHLTTIMLKHRLQETRCPTNFLEFYNKFLSGIGYNTTQFAAAVNRYNNSYGDYYLPFMEKHEYILEDLSGKLCISNLFSHWALRQPSIK